MLSKISCCILCFGFQVKEIVSAISTVLVTTRRNLGGHSMEMLVNVSLLKKCALHLMRYIRPSI